MSAHTLADNHWGRTRRPSHRRILPAPSQVFDCRPQRRLLGRSAQSQIRQRLRVPDCAPTHRHRLHRSAGITEASVSTSNSSPHWGVTWPVRVPRCQRSPRLGGSAAIPRRNSRNNSPYYRSRRSTIDLPVRLTVGCRATMGGQIFSLPQALGWPPLLGSRRGKLQPSTAGLSGHTLDS
jgi:hypothetical protein